MSQRSGPNGSSGGGASGGLFASRARSRPYVARARLPPVERAKMRPPQQHLQQQQHYQQHHKQQQHQQPRWRAVEEEDDDDEEEEDEEGEDEKQRARLERVRRVVDYAPSTRSLGAAARFRGHAEEYDFEPQLRDTGASPSLSAKSCDNIFTRHWGSCAPPLWQENTRSEEALYAGPVGAAKSGHNSFQKMTSARSMGHVSTRHYSGAKEWTECLLLCTYISG